MEKNINLLFIIAIVGFILYEFFGRDKTNENFAETTTAITSDQVKQMIREIYLADIDAIRNLSNVATKLSTGGYTAPGNFTVSGTHTSNSLSTKSLSVSQNGRKIDCGVESDNTAYIDFNSLTNGTNDRDARITATGGTAGTNEKATLNINAGLITVNNTFSVKNTSGNVLSVNAGTTDQDKLQVFKNTNGVAPYLYYNKDGGFGVWTGSTSPWKLEENGNLSVQGNISTNGIVYQKRNKARYIKVGNAIDTKLQEGYWTLIELQAYDHAGNNVALNKTVTLVSGTAYSNSLVSKITDGNIFSGGSNLSSGNNNNSDNSDQGFHGNTGSNVIQIDLGSEIDLAEIVLFNRWNENYDSRMDGTTIELIGADGVRNRIIYTGLWHRQYSKEYLL